MELEERAVERIRREFAAEEHAVVVELLAGYRGPEAARVAWDILQLSAGAVDKVRQYVGAAQTDYRDVLYWAEYYATDPLVRGKDPEKLVADLLKKVGDKS